MEPKKALKKQVKGVKSKFKELKKVSKDDMDKSLSLCSELLLEIKELKALEITKYDPKLQNELSKSEDMLTLYVKNLQEIDKINKKWKKKS